MLSLSSYTTETFPKAINALLMDKAAQLEVPSQRVLALLEPKQVERYFEMTFRNKNSGYTEKPKLLDYVAQATPHVLADSGGWTGLAGVIFSHFRKTYEHSKERSPLDGMISRFVFARPLLSLELKEQGMMRAMAELLGRELISSKEWRRFEVLMTYKDFFSCEPEPAIAREPRVREAKVFLQELLTKCGIIRHEAFLAETAALIADRRKSVFSPGHLLSTGDGARWMSEEDLDSSPFYKTRPSMRGVLLGISSDKQREVFFEGNESVISFGGPGSGKTQAHVVTNLLTCPGSAVVLDVKGELWDQTAAHREKHFGPVYRFAPTDASGQTHRFNPFDFISRDPDEAANDCEVFSYQIIAPNPHLKEPYFENKGRDFLWAFAMALVLRAEPQYHTLDGLAELMATRTDFKSTKSDDFLDSETCGLINSLVELSDSTGIPDLEQAANALLGGMGSQRMESVMDAGRRYLSIFSRSGTIRNAMKTSDWKPRDLRTKPGTTIYLCIPNPSEFAPIIRLIFYQHYRELKKKLPGKDEPPITFYLDEMPQLGNFQSILEMQDVGRGYGLRLWMLAQYYGQLKDAYGERAQGIVQSCRVRCFMEPDEESARLIEPALGEVTLFTGEKRPLATLDELMGRTYRNHVIVTTRGDLPMILNKRLADKDPGLMKLIKSPPRVRRRP